MVQYFLIFEMHLSVDGIYKVILNVDDFVPICYQYFVNKIRICLAIHWSLKLVSFKYCN